MAVNFGMLQSVAPGRVVGEIATEPSSGGGIGELLSGLAGLVGTRSTSFNGAQGQASSGMSTTPPNTYGSNAVRPTMGGPVNNVPFRPVIAQNAGLQSLAQKGVNMELNPQFASVLPKVMDELKARGYQPIVASGLRTQEEQAKKVAEGSSKTMKSNHLHGNAVDIIDSRYGWNTDKYGKEIGQFAKDMADITQKYGLGSGTKWKSFGPYGDFAHVQFQGNGQQKANTNVAQAAPSSYKLDNAHPELDYVMAGISNVETGGAKNPYASMSIRSKNGDRAYGKYQIMGNNIPSWTREALGRPMTAQEFLADPQAQEQTAAYQINRNLEKYSPDDAASIWFSGRPQKKAGNSRDAYGTTVPQYVNKFNQGYLKAKEASSSYSVAPNQEVPKIGPQSLNDQYQNFPPRNSLPIPPPPLQLASAMPMGMDKGQDAGTQPYFDGNHKRWSIPGTSQMPRSYPPDPERIPRTNGGSYGPAFQTASNGINWGLLQSLLQQQGGQA